jgi:hypothetical protein
MIETTPTTPNRPVELSPTEIELLITALRLLRSTLGREEADELAEVNEILEKLQG